MARRGISTLYVGSPFTPREQQVYDLLAQGYPNLNIASCLGISLNTVKVMVSRILVKKGAATRFEIAAGVSNRPFDKERYTQLLMRRIRLTHEINAINETLALLGEPNADKALVIAFDSSNHNIGKRTDISKNSD